MRSDERLVTRSHEYSTAEVEVELKAARSETAGRSLTTGKRACCNTKKARPIVGLFGRRARFELGPFGYEPPKLPSSLCSALNYMAGGLVIVTLYPEGLCDLWPQNGPNHPLNESESCSNDRLLSTRLLAPTTLKSPGLAYGPKGIDQNTA